MNLITKLLRENKYKVFRAEFIINGKREKGILVGIRGIEEMPYGEDLLEEVQERIFVSTLEWELLNYWIDMGVKQIRKYEFNDDIRLIDFNDYCQHLVPNPLFNFLEHNKIYNLKDLINRCALIEG